MGPTVEKVSVRIRRLFVLCFCVCACDSDRLVDVIRRFIVCVVQSPTKCVDIIKIPLFVRVCVFFCLSLAKQAREN